MDDSEDVKKIDEIIRKHKIEAQDPDDDLEYAEFIDSSDSNDEDNSNEIEEDYEIPSFPKSDITKFNSYNPSQFLTEEEKRVIESCPDPDLKQLLLLNRNKNIQLMQVYKKIKDLLEECQKNIFIKEEFLRATKNGKRVWNRIWRLGIPYFKTKDDFPCPRNEDIIRKHKNGELLFYDMTSSNKWLERDMNRLLKGVSFHYKISKEEELEKNIKLLEKEITEEHDTEKEEIVQELKNDLEDMKNSEITLYPPLGCNKYLNWNRIAEFFLKDRYSAQDCQIFWNTFLHPEINKNSWTPEENERLKTVAAEYNYQNWDLIAAELGNNRSGFVTCVHYFSKIDPPRHGRFSEAEDNVLMYLVQKYQQGNYIPWTKIAHCFENRTRGQLFYRYKYFLSCESRVIRGKFSEAEDILILVLVDRFGNKFTKCGEYFPNRSVVQIKARYFSNLRGALKKGSFTVEEDKEILEFVKKNGPSKWEPLVSRLKRCGGQVRQRYKTLKAFVQANPGVDVEKAPRRKYSSIAFDSEYRFLRVMSDKFKNCEKIPTLREIEQLLKKHKPIAGPLTTKPPEGHRTYENKEKASRNKPRELQSEKTTQEQQEETTMLDAESPPPPDATDDVDNVHETFPNVNLSVDNLLVDFFNNSSTSNFVNRIDPSHMQKAVAVATSLLTSLRAELHIPTNFTEDERLDSIDRELLKMLTLGKPVNSNGESVIQRENFQLEKLIPPNLNTVVGMRNLLVKNQIYKTKHAKRAYIFESFKTECKDKQVQWCINNHLVHQPEDTKHLLVLERSLFFKRFVSLFKFPAIMTLQKPSELLETSSKAWKEEFTTSVKTYTMKKARPCLTDVDNRDHTKFEGVFIKQPPQEELIDLHVKASVEGNASKTNPSRSYQSKNKLAKTASKTITGESTQKSSSNGITACEPKLSIVEQLKRRINNTIDELNMSPPPKKYYKDIFLPIPMKESYGSKKTNPPVGRQRGMEKFVPRKTYMSKTKVKPKIVAAALSASNKDCDQRKHTSVIVSEKNVVVKIEKDKGSVSQDNRQTHSSFNLGKGELVLETESPVRSSSVNQDLIDLTALDALLKKEKDVDADENFDF